MNCTDHLPEVPANSFTRKARLDSLLDHFMEPNAQVRMALREAEQKADRDTAHLYSSI
jgi:DNA-binding ferritin-like protein